MVAAQGSSVTPLQLDFPAAGVERGSACDDWLFGRNDRASFSCGNLTAISRVIRIGRHANRSAEQRLDRKRPEAFLLRLRPSP